MDTYQLRLFVYYFNICIRGDSSLEVDSQGIRYLDQDLAKFGI